MSEEEYFEDLYLNPNDELVIREILEKKSLKQKMDEKDIENLLNILPGILDYIGAKKDKCEVPGCQSPKMWEGWYRCIDPFTGKSSGMNQKRYFCNAHRVLFIGYKKEEENVSVKS